MKYRSDIDGLRAIAVIGVVLSHAGITLFSGGYVGVDVFFVISGFLITTIIYEEIKQKKFSIIHFYERRVRRIFPALFVMMLVTTVFAYFIFLPIHFKSYSQSMIAATLFGSNILFWKEAGYFTEASETKPLLHTWSLGVEEQFYILFPLLLLFLYRYFRERLPVWVIVLTVFSFAISFYGVMIRPAATFFLLPTRAWELFAGGLLVLGVFPTIKNPKTANALALLGMMFIIYATVVFTKVTPFPGGNALFPVLGTLLIIYSGIYHETLVSRYLSSKGIVFIGLISYSLYLWHWPLIIFYKYYVSRELLPYEIVVIVLMSFILSLLSWRYIETPFRKKTVLSNRPKLFMTASAVMVLAVSIGGWLYITKGYPERLEGSIRGIVLANESAMTNWMYPDKYNNYKNRLTKATEMNYYVLDNARGKKVLFWGDSHIGMLFPAIQSVFQNQQIGYGAILGTSGSCLPVKNFNRIEGGYFCDRFNLLLSERAEKDDIVAVVIGSRWDYIGNSLSKDKNRKKVLALETVKEKLRDEVARLIKKNKKVYIILPFPRYNHSVPLIVAKQYMFNQKESSALCDKAYNGYADLKKIDKILREIAAETGAKILDPKETLCDKGQCVYEMDGVSIYRDSSHLNTVGALMMKEMIKKIVIENNNETKQNTDLFSK